MVRPDPAVEPGAGPGLGPSLGDVLRSLAFYAVFYAGTLFYVLASLAALPFGREAASACRSSFSCRSSRSRRLPSGRT